MQFYALPLLNEEKKVKNIRKWMALIAYNYQIAIIQGKIIVYSDLQ